MALAMSSMVASLRNTRLQAASYDRLRVRNDESLPVSPRSSGPDNLTGLTLQEILANDQANINALLEKKKTTVAAWSKAEGGLLSLDVMLADMRDLVKKVAAGGMSNVKVAHNQSLFEAIKAEINALLASTGHKGEQLLISSDALVSVDMSALASVDLADDIGGAVATVDGAIETSSRAGKAAGAKLLVLAEELAALEVRGVKIDTHEDQLDLVASAQSGLKKLVDGFMQKLASALVAVQANVDPDRAAALLGGELGGDESSDASATSDASTGRSSGSSESTTAKLVAYTQKDAE